MGVAYVARDFWSASEHHNTKDRKKGCAYDPGALNKQGALKNQTLR